MTIKKAVPYVLAVLTAALLSVETASALAPTYGVTKGTEKQWAITQCWNATTEVQCTDQWIFGSGSENPRTGLGSEGDIFWRTDTGVFEWQKSGVWTTISPTANNQFFTLTADATVQYGQTVMPDAGTDNRFDVTTGSATTTIGVLGGTGPSAQGTSYSIYYGGLARVAIAEDQAVTRGHHLLQSATAGYCNDSATVSTDGLNIAKALESEAVSAVIDPTGCGGSGCINTALDTPASGPAGQITLGVDVAALSWVVNDAVIYWNSGGTTPTGLTDGKVYFLKSVSTTKVTIAATVGGAVVVPSTQGTDATQYLLKLPQAVVSVQ